MQKEYKTVLRAASADFEEKKSKFIANVKPVAAEEEALGFINSVRSRYWDATHNVYAYYIGGGGGAQRYTDDGEPSGTAGVPVLEAIKRAGLQDVAVVVTRYFGGTLLGAAGLIRAYGRCAALGLEAAVVIRRRLCAEFRVTLEYSLYGKAAAALAERDYAVKKIIYGQDVEIIVYVPVDETESFTAFVTELANGRALVERGEEVYVTLDDRGGIIAGDG